jgi:uncharacterized protein (DUF2384 family)
VTIPVSVFEKLADTWSLTTEERNCLRVCSDQVVAIHQALTRIFEDPGRASDWIKKPNAAFGGQSALDLILAGDIEQVLKHVMYQLYNGY